MLRSCSTLNDSPCFYMGPAVLGALLSVGAIGVAYAESEEVYLTYETKKSNLSVLIEELSPSI